MPPKKSTATTSKASKQRNGVANKDELPTSKDTSRTKTKLESQVTKATGNGNKRKAENELEDEFEEPMAKLNGKRPRNSKEPTPAAGQRRKRDTSEEPTGESSSAQAVKPPPARKQKTTATTSTQAAKKPAEKKRKVSKVINHAPTKRLNVYVFGVGDAGELGLGSGKGKTEVKRPRLNPLLTADEVGVVQVAVGGMHTAVLTHDNKILTWGVNDQGALGRDTSWDGGMRDVSNNKDSDDDDSDSGEGDINPHESEPAEVDVLNLPEGTVFTQVVCTDSATFMLSDEGLVYGCGTFRSNEGIFGFSSSALIEPRPVLVDGLKKITKLSCGANHVLALTNTGGVYAWGSGQQNQLGRRILERHQKSSLTPTQFGLKRGMTDIGTGSYHSFAIHGNGDVYSWGLNSFGETGIPKTEDEDAADVHHPEVIKSLRGRGNVICIEGGAHHTIAVTDKGECLVWGRLDAFQMGIKIADLPKDAVIYDSREHPRILTIPTQIPDIDAVQAAAGPDHCIAIARDGKAYAWGFSSTYQTGLGTDDDVEVAQHIDNTAVRGKQLVWAGAGGQFSVMAGLADVVAPLTNGVNGHK